MRFTLDAASSWWTVPIPVKRSGFTAFAPSHQIHDVETDLGAIGAFSLTTGDPGGELLYADLQTLPRVNLWRRHGSGRAGVHRGAYLKGMGRTTLAANWSDPVDRYHNSGHMLPSAAVREYLISRALEAMGEGGSIVPCTGLLLRELKCPIDGFLEEMLPEARGGFAAIDRSMQAISVKPADFARFSNFIWALDHLGAPSRLAEVLFSLHAYLLPPGARPADGSGSSPAAIARALAAAVERGFAHFAAYTRAGVFWGSMNNNFTADGRFLDLEVPMALCRPFFGVVCEGDGSLGSRDFAGLELFSFARQAGEFVTWLRERMRFLAGHVFRRGFARDFAAELAAELEVALPREHRLWSRERLVDAAVASVATALELDPARRARVREIAERQHAAILRGQAADWSDLRLRRVRLDVAPPEPGLHRWFAVPDFLAGVCDSPSEMGRRLNQGLRWIEDAPAAGELFSRLRVVAASLAPSATADAATLELAS